MWIPLSLALLGCTEEPPCRADIRAWEDLDGDGYGLADLGLVCALGAGQVEQGLDCDDADPEIAPEARERCNQVDDDCDGEIDEELRLRQYWQDVDGDGFAGLFPSQLACARPGADWYQADDDCDDDDPIVHPAGNEVCGGTDEDCDGDYDELDESIDPASFTTFYRDADGDGSGDRERSHASCHGTLGWVDNADDCDDTDPTFDYLDLYDDADGDGFGDPGSPTTGCLQDEGKATNGDDCDDNDPDVLDERDWYEDDDGDGWGSGPSQGFACRAPRPGLVGFGGDCDESSTSFNPGVQELCRDGLDQNCDLMVDCDDPQCAASPSCLPPCADDTWAPQNLPDTVRGNTRGTGNDLLSTCGGGGVAEEYAYWFTPPQSGLMTFDAQGSPYDTVLFALVDCGAPTLICNDDYYGLQSRIDVNVTAGVPLLVVIDGYAGQTGSYTVNAHF